MKQVLFLIVLAEDKYIRSYRCIILVKSFQTLTAFYTLMVRVFHGRLSNIEELENFFISFKSFYDVASVSACSKFVLNFLFF